ncbi:hypothetical protein M8756_08275 [Lutimaribacter sp. EGI FJ00015]|uniref:Uncharacterized protein n=1 Tax=Lutimaribacter degradans TaxID=2945989 RepID=A0ACC5ZVC4_9RHOB|nr:hypothetical protein [Lutimaribacter sp. EGI FJ00013]MCM2562150.1 hypothetical protein [Lutimaribacter sp. EGI FJ00013]MCO0613303.1 hypothetical protein [Lutimaribacter sp. EGI FJ00015]MCO0636280.1 hypothetical protein [Lutimaribacter sp. EGI FJ00014]
MAQHSDLLTATLTLTPPARGETAWSAETEDGVAGHVIPAGRGPGHVRLHGLAFDISLGQLNDGQAALWRPWQMTLEGPNLFHAWTVPRRSPLSLLTGRKAPIFVMDDHAPPLQMVQGGGLHRQVALVAGSDLLALAEHPRGRAPRHIRHAPTLPPAIQAALCHAVTQPG